MKKINAIMLTILIIGNLMLLSLAIINAQDWNSEDIKNKSGEEIVLLNDLSQYCSRHWNETEESFEKYMNQFVKRENKRSFCILNKQEKIRFSYGDIEASNLNEAYKNHHRIGDIWVDEMLVGKIILKDEVYQDISFYMQKFYIVLYVFIILSIVVELGYVLYIKKNIIKPFHNLKAFASEIAQGNLDTPLAKEKSNLFGDFTESFDIMREELQLSQKREDALRKKKEELAISLNHDIKAPIAAIKAIAELTALKVSKDSISKEQLLIKLGEINGKAMQTNMLVSNMLNVSIDSENDLSPHIDYYRTDELISVLERTDYRDKISTIEMEPCLIKTDIAKLTQVFDNCIINSYKYADTSIQIYGKAEMDGRFCICIKDQGNTLKVEEVENLCIKYFRGSNVGKKDGSGLGLYVCKSIMESMDGELYCQQEPDGFCVKLYLPM